jgi:hypothetical protein
VYTDKTQMFMGRSRKMGKTLSRDELLWWKSQWMTMITTTHNSDADMGQMGLNRLITWVL